MSLPFIAFGKNAGSPASPKAPSRLQPPPALPALPDPPLPLVPHLTPPSLAHLKASAEAAPYAWNDPSTPRFSDQLLSFKDLLLGLSLKVS